MKQYWTAFFLFLAANISNLAYADSQIRSSSSWTIKGETIAVVFTINIEDAKKLIINERLDEVKVLTENALLQSSVTNISDELAQLQLIVLKRHIRLASLDDVCLSTKQEVLPSSIDHFRLQLVFSCGESTERVTINMTSLFQLASQHIHVANLSSIKSEDKRQVLTLRKANFNIDLKTSSGDATNKHEGQAEESNSILFNYLLLGYEHILIGADHLAFVFALMLLVTRRKELLLLITGFTLGHSITLTMSVLGVVSPNILWVEALIAFSIILLAIENDLTTGKSARNITIIVVIAMLVLALIKQQDISGFIALSGLTLFSVCYLNANKYTSSIAYWRLIVTILFGLIHGFGFAAVLTEIGLPQQQLLLGLFAFNLGVELGQISFVIFCSCFIWLLSKYSVINRQLLVEFSVSGLTGLGVYWFVSRTMTMI